MPLRTMADATASACRDLARLVVPVECAGCAMPDVPWCQDCHAEWWQPAVRVDSGAPRLDIEGRTLWPVWAIAPLMGSPHATIAAWKDQGRRDLDRHMSGAMVRLARDSAPALARRAIDLVPAPARRASTRRRGTDLPLLLARAARIGLSHAGVRAHIVPSLRIGGGESRHDTARGRWRNASTAVRLRGEPPSRAVVLIDDVLTTGATLAACARVLEEAGATVAGALVLAAASGRTRVGSPLWWDQRRPRVDHLRTGEVM